MSFCSTSKIKANRGHTSKTTGQKVRHVCDWCGGRIEIAAPAVSFACMWEGDFGNGYFHPECFHASQKAPEDYPGEGIEFTRCYGRGRMDDRRDLPPQFPATLELEGSSK